MPVFASSQRHIPDALKPHDHWVLWGLDEQERKRPLAPWIRGDLYPAKWGSSAPERPETDFETAMRHWRHRANYSAPTGMDRESILPAPLLLHDPLDPPLMQVDFDDVRDPETGEVSQEVADIVDDLGGYCEISQSGEGLHVFVRAELPGKLGKFIGDLADIGEIELYDHGRAVGATWDHVDGTPTDVPHVQETINEIVRGYEDASQRKRRIGSVARDGGSPASVSVNTAHGSTDDSGQSKRSSYFDIDIRTVADTGHFSRHRSETTDEWSGPHPAHGPISSSPENCTNFGIRPGDNVWYCFAHDAGGRAIELAAVLCSKSDVDCADVPSRSASDGWLRKRPQDLLAACLWLRDGGAVSADAKPPYDALLAVADLVDLHIRDPDAGILGERNAEVARAVYDDLELTDL